MSATQEERDRAARLGRLAAGAGRGLGGACPYRAGGDAKQRQLALVFVRAYHEAGGTLDGIDYGDGSTATRAPRRKAAPAPGAGRHRAADGPYGHLGYGR